MHRLCALADLPDHDARGFRTPLGDVVVARKGLQVYGYRNRCPHIGICLNFQPDVFMDVGQNHLMCANHGALFRVEDGHCLHGPCQGQSLHKVSVVVEKGIVWLLLPHAQ